MREAVNLAESLAQQTGSSFEATDAVLQRMNYWAQRGVAPPKRPILRALLGVRTPSMAEIGELAFFDKFGNRVVRSGPPLSPDVEASERRAFAWQATHPSLEPFIVAPALSANALSTMTLSRRFNDPRGRFAGIVIATIRMASLVRSYDAVDVGRSGAISLALADGTTLFRKPSPVPAGGVRQPSGKLSLRTHGALSGSLEVRSRIDGHERLVAFRRVDLFPLVVVVGFGASETFAEWRLVSGLGLLGVCAVLVTILLLARGLLDELRRSASTQAQLSLYASRDGLTGLFNRRELDAAIEREWAMSLSDGSSLALMMIDVDSFKAYNDRYGHQSGDEVLKRIAASICDNCTRPRDFVARYGGEEFAVLVPSTPADGARDLAERVRVAVAACNVPHEGSPYGIVTISVGVSEIAPGGDNVSTELIRVADQALYVAKRAGRNRVVVSPTGPALVSSVSVEKLL